MKDRNLMTPSDVIIFARAPKIGVGKRRLAHDVGDRAAYDFYNANLQRLIQELSGGTWQLHVAVASELEQHHPVFKHLSVIVQPEGDLGYRMSTVLSQFHGRARLIVGSDIPELDCTHVQDALSALSSHQLVFGPALDGGFWGVGCSARYTPDAHFMQGVRWSSVNALADTLATVVSGTAIAEVTRLADVDDIDSYKEYLASTADRSRSKISH